MMPSSASPAVWTPWAYCRCRSSSSVVSRSPVRPITPFIGVRISWLMVARKSDLSREASMAASRADASSVSIRLRPLMSLTMQRDPA